MGHLEKYNPYAAGHVEPVDCGAHRLWRITEEGKQDGGCVQALIAMGYRQTDIADGLWEYQGDTTEKPDEPRELIALLDMDGTMADFDGAMLNALERIASPGEPALIGPDGRYADLPHIRSRRRLIRNQPGFWRSLPTYAPGFEILRELKALKFRCHVLTKGPARESAGWTEKVEWCRAHLPGVPVVIAEDKSLVYGRVLVDDWPEYYQSWLKYRPRGLVVVPAHPWNVGESHPQTVRYDGSNIAEVRERLRQASEREEQEE
jgi:5'-nucleotidase